MDELIRRSDCYFLEVPCDTGQEILDETEGMVDELITQFEYDWDRDHIKEFAYAIILKCQHFVDSAPVVGNIAAWRCPWCHSDFIDYNGDGLCPTCNMYANSEEEDLRETYHE